MTEKEIISGYFRKMAAKSVAARKKKWGGDSMREIRNQRPNIKAKLAEMEAKKLSTDN